MAEVFIGKKVEKTRVFTYEDIEVFSAVSNDFHSAQSDAGSGRRIVHSALLAAAFNGLIKDQLPGPSAAILEQSFNYLNPVYANERMTLTVEIIAVQASKNLAIIQTICTNQDDVKVLDGESVVYIPDMEVVEKSGE